MRKGIMALEGLEEAIVDAPATDFADAPENDLLDMNEAGKNMDETNDGIEEGVDTAAALNKMGDSLAESAENGGMSEPEAEAVMVAVEHMLLRVGFPKNMRGKPAMEGFSNKATRVRVTLEAMEFIKDNANKIMDSLANAFESAKKWLVEHFEKMKLAVGKLKERAAGLVAAGRAKSKEKWEQFMLSASSFKQWINVEGKYLSAKDFVSKYVAMVKGDSIKSVAAKQEAIAAYGEALEKYTSAMGTADDLAALDAAEATMKAAESKVTGHLGVIGETKLMFGNASTWITEKASGLVSIKVAPSAGGETADASEVEALSPEQVAAVAAAAEAQMVTIKGWEAVQLRITKAQDAITASLKKIKGKVVEGGEKAYAAMKERCQNFMAMSTTGLTSLKAYFVNLGKGAMDYCSASLSKLKGGAAPAAGAEAPAAAAA